MIKIYSLFAGGIDAIQLCVRSHRSFDVAVEQHVGHDVVGDFGAVVARGIGCTPSRACDEKQEKTCANMITMRA